MKKILLMLLVCASSAIGMNNDPYVVAHNPDFSANEKLILGIQSNDLETVKKAVRDGADVNTIADMTPLCVAVMMNASLEILQFLIDNGADVNKGMAFSMFGITGYATPLELSLKNGRTAIRNLLIRNGASSAN